MGEAFAELAVMTNDTINLAVGSKFKPPNAESSNTTFAVSLLELTKEVANLGKKGRHRGRDSDGGDGRGGTTGDAGGGAKKKKCRYCGRAHLKKTPEDLCFERPENAPKVPVWCKRAKAKCEEK
jgi:hypothetical protein